MAARFNRLLEWWARFERPLAAASMVIGFSFDLVVAKRPDSVFDNLLLLFYLFLSASCILVLNLRGARQREIEVPNPAPEPEPLLLLLILQFCFGGLSSNLLILYGKSGTPAGSIIFLGLLFGMLVGNEFLRTRYAQTRFNIAVWYLLLLTYSIIAVPTFLLHQVGWRVFLISGAVSVVAAGLFLFALVSLTTLFRGKMGKRNLWQSAGTGIGILLIFNILYFTNIIPPVPLSLKSVGIYHSLSKDSADSYVGQYEATPWFEFWRDTSATYHLAAGQSSAYCFSSVFAPAGLETPVVHYWKKYDTGSGSWQTVGKISFPISGGRADGYRGFSVEENLTPGAWRCDVETSGAQIIGRVQFSVVSSAASPTLTTTPL